MSQPDPVLLAVHGLYRCCRAVRTAQHAVAPRLAAHQGLALHNEVFASTRESAGCAAALALALDDARCLPREAGDEAQDRRSVLWVQTREAARRVGRPYRAGLPQTLQGRVIHVLAEKAEDALFALEEGLRCRDLAFVLGEIAGNPKALDFTASRRLTLASERHGGALVPRAARCRARPVFGTHGAGEVASAPSPAPHWNQRAPGTPRWRAELFRARAHAPGEWVLGEEQGGLMARKPDEETGEAAANWAAGLRLRHPLRRA
jgi:protein ImuA